MFLGIAADQADDTSALGDTSEPEDTSSPTDTSSPADTGDTAEAPIVDLDGDGFSVEDGDCDDHNAER